MDYMDNLHVGYHWHDPVWPGEGGRVEVDVILRQVGIVHQEVQVLQGQLQLVLVTQHRNGNHRIYLNLVMHTCTVTVEMGW